jgi:hypothetical protein
MNMEIGGLWPRHSYSGSICLEFSVMVLCSERISTTKNQQQRLMFSRICNMQTYSYVLLCLEWIQYALYKKSDLCIPEMKLHGLLPNSYIHVSVSDLYISRIGLPIWLQQNRQTDLGNIYKSLPAT